MTGPVDDLREVADYDFAGLADEALPDGEALVERARADGHEWLAISLRATRDDWGVVHPRPSLMLGAGESRRIALLDLPEARKARFASGRLRTFEEVLLAAHRAGISLFIRVHTTAALGPLAGGLGVMGAETPAALRERYVAVVDRERLGRRLRAEAPIAPSALEVGPGGRGIRAVLGRRMPNLARAAAAADDLVLALTLARGRARVQRLKGVLAKRGARLWIARVAPDATDAARTLGADGIVVRRRW